MNKVPLYDILTFDGERIYTGFANDTQCSMYYDPETNETVSYQHIESHNMEVIEAGYYEEYPHGG